MTVFCAQLLRRMSGVVTDWDCDMKHITKQQAILAVPSLKLTFSPLKMDGWNTFSFPFGMAYFQGRAVSFRECIFWGANPLPACQSPPG